MTKVPIHSANERWERMFEVVERLNRRVAMLEARVPPPLEPDTDLVWERLPSGEFAWLKADLTVPR